MGFFIFVIFALALVCVMLVSWAYVVPQQVIYIIEAFGRFSRADGAGIHFKRPFVDRVAGKVSLRVQQLDNQIVTKTLDNVYVTCEVSVQYQVNANKVADAFYKLENPEMQIKAYVEDAVRSAIPQLDLDDAYTAKDEIAGEVQSVIADAMNDYGYVIVKTLVTSIEPDKSIREAMNSINEANRKREAAKAQAEADRIVTVTKAEAEREKMRLRGEGIAQQRQAIVDGLTTSMRQLKESGLSDSEIMTVLLMNQYIDTLNQFAGDAGTHTIFLPAGPSGVEDMRTQLLSALDASGARARTHVVRPDSAPSSGAARPVSGGAGTRPAPGGTVPRSRM